MKYNILFSNNASSLINTYFEIVRISDDINRYHKLEQLILHGNDQASEEIHISPLHSHI
jgi:hypothetical protein